MTARIHRSFNANEDPAHQAGESPVREDQVDAEPMPTVACGTCGFRHTVGGMKHGARERFAAGRVARLATMSPDSRPHLVPVVFAVVGDTVWTAVDAKPKSTRSLRRLANIEANPRVSLLVDHYEEDWSALWWVRVDGKARLVSVGSAEGAAGVAAWSRSTRTIRGSRRRGRWS